MKVPSGRIAAPVVITATIYVVLLLSSLPRVVHPSIPYNFSGLDVAIPVALGGLLLSCLLRGNIIWPHNLLQMFILLPVLMGVMALAGYFVSNDSSSMLRAALQAVRRLAPALFCLLLCQVRFSMEDSQRLLKLWLLSLVLGAVFFMVVDNYSPLGLKNRTVLIGNFLQEMGEGDSDEPGFQVMSNARMAGNAASPTTFGVLCAIGLVVVNHQMQRRQISFFGGALIYLTLCGALIASAAKAAIACAGLAQLIQLRNNMRMMVALLACAVVVGFIYHDNIANLVSTLNTRSSSSMDERFGKYDEAANLIAHEPIRYFIGAGFRSDEIGWHNEAIEIVMGYGVLAGTIVICLVYLYLPFALFRLPPGTAELIPNGLLFVIYGLIFVSSLFQDLFHDSYILFALVLLIGLRYQTIPVEEDTEFEDEEIQAVEN